MYDFGKNPYYNIKSMQDVHNHVTFQVVLNQRDLISHIPQVFIDHFPKNEKSPSIYFGDDQRPTLTFSTNDRFFEEAAGRNLREISIELAQGRKDIWILLANDPNLRVGQPLRPQHFLRMFGRESHWGNSQDSVSAQAVGWAIAKLLESVGETVTVGEEFRSFEAIFPHMDYDAWREWALTNGKLIPQDSEADREVFNETVLSKINFLPANVVEMLTSLSYRYQDHTFNVCLCGQRIVIKVGIDKKLIPFYEKKFASET